METDQKLKKAIGTKEAEKLKPAKVIAVGISIKEIKKGDKIIGEKVVVICKYPEKENPIELSTVKFLKGDKLKTSALWYNLDDDELIVKNSALAEWMRHNKLESLESIENKEFDTVEDDSGYLCFKAY